IVDDFAPLPVLRASLAQAEVVGTDALRELGSELWDGVDPFDRLVVGRPLRVERSGDSFTLVVELPFADHDDLDVAQSGAELVVAVGPHRRNLVLPESLRRREVTSASLLDGCLRVRFDEPA
ncbi:MAG: ArsA family ATPase, partial [Actinomycetes bacterium]